MFICCWIGCHALLDTDQMSSWTPDTYKKWSPKGQSSLEATELSKDCEKVIRGLHEPIMCHVMYPFCVWLSVQISKVLALKGTNQATVKDVVDLSCTARTIEHHDVAAA